MDGPGLKVLYISSGYTTHDRRFLSSFVLAGWSVVHLPMTSERLDTRPLPAGVEWLDWNDGEWPAARADWLRLIGRLELILKDLQPDVTIAGPIQSGALIAALAGAKPLVTVSWGTDVLVDADRDRLCGHASERALNSSALAFGDCRAVREAIKLHSALTDEAIITFPWGIDLEKYRPSTPAHPLRGQLGWTACEVFISTRAWEPVYAIDVLLDAFAEVRRSRPGARLLLLGDGSLREELNAQIARLGLSKAVHAAGRVSQDDMAGLFTMSDVYVSSALSDGTSVSLLEAMACGLPAVVSDSYGNLEWVSAGVNGALAVPGNAGSLAQAMLTVVGDSAAREAMGKTNAAEARLRANWNVNFPVLSSAVERLVNK